MAENYLQHAEHYNRIIMAAQAQAAQPAIHVAGDGAQATNGLHRGGRDGAGALREQSQPQINAPASDAPPPQPVPLASNQAADDQPSVGDQPVAEEASPGEAKAASTGGDANGEAETGRRRRRRYPGNGASRSSSSSSAPENENGKAEAASSEGQTSDEATA